MSPEVKSNLTAGAAGTVLGLLTAMAAPAVTAYFSSASFSNNLVLEAVKASKDKGALQAALMELCERRFITEQKHCLKSTPSEQKEEKRAMPPLERPPGG